MTITLFVGDCTGDLANAAKKFSRDAYMLESANVENFLNSNDVTCTVYTSFADLPKISMDRAVFYEVLKKADKIYYAPPTVWSDYTPGFSLQNQQRITEYFLYLVNLEKNNVVNLDIFNYTSPKYLNLQSQRITSTFQMWVTGCSVTAGVGVEYDEKYPVLVAKEHNLLWSDLSLGGSSIEFQADQILRSNIQKEDIVLWGITSEYRATIWSEERNQLRFLNAHKFDHYRTNQADDVCDETRTYKAMISIHQVINFCNKIGARLIMVPILCTENLQLMLHCEPSYYQLPYKTKPIDFGSDGSHPGPDHHRWYADQIINIIKKIL
jgi:hypothetical protein